MKTLTKTAQPIEVTFKSKILLGQVDGENIYLSAPSWDCGWYWGFGYLGNKDCHYHVDGIHNGENINMFDAFKKHFDEGSFVLQDENKLWTLCELFKTFYVLKATAELYKQGCAGYTLNPLKSQLKNKKQQDHINKVLMPQIFNEIHKLLM